MSDPVAQRLEFHIQAIDKAFEALSGAVDLAIKWSDILQIECELAVIRFLAPSGTTVDLTGANFQELKDSVEADLVAAYLPPTGMFAADDNISALLRDSTRYAESGDWESAFVALKAAKRRMIVSPVQFPVETWCKYGLYLSRAGRYEEAMIEFDWLLADLPRRARKESFMHDPNFSFGRGTSKTEVYCSKLENGEMIIEAKRAVAKRREEKSKRRA